MALMWSCNNEKDDPHTLNGRSYEITMQFGMMDTIYFENDSMYSTGTLNSDFEKMPYVFEIINDTFVWNCKFTSNYINREAIMDFNGRVYNENVTGTVALGLSDGQAKLSKFEGERLIR